MRRFFGLVRMAAVVFLTLLTWPTDGLAETPLTSSINVRVSATQASPGTPFFISASGFQGREPVVVIWEIPSFRPNRPVEQEMLAGAQADDQGVAEAISVILPATITPGQHLLLVKGLQSRQSAYIMISVQTNWDRFSCSMVPKGQKTTR